MKLRVTISAKMGRLVGDELRFWYQTLNEVLEFDQDPKDDEIRDAFEKLPQYWHCTFQEFEVRSREVITP